MLAEFESMANCRPRLRAFPHQLVAVADPASFDDPLGRIQSKRPCRGRLQMHIIPLGQERRPGSRYTDSNLVAEKQCRMFNREKRQIQATRDTATVS